MWQRRRRMLAIATALLWIAAIEVLPGLHLSTHRDDHTHASDGSIHAVAHVELHEHGGMRHRHRRPYPVPPSLREDAPAAPLHVHASPKRKRGPRALAIDNAPAAHTAFGVAHYALATLDPSPPLVSPVSAPVATAWMHTIEATSVLARPTARPTARGPPSA